MKTTRKSLWASGLSLLVCLTLLIGTTFAWFTDSISNKGNVIQAGSLDVVFQQLDKETGDYKDVTEDTPIFDYDKWEPGYSVSEAFRIGNEGSLALKYQLNLVANEEVSKLADVIDVYYMTSNEQIGNDNLATGMDSLDSYFYAGTLSEILSGENGAANGHLEKGESDYAAIVLHMKESAGNEYMGLSIGTTFDLVLNATQYTSETDGFDSNQYDKDAPLDFISVANETELKEALESGQPVSLNEDISLTERIRPTGNLIIQGNGNTIDTSQVEGNQNVIAVLNVPDTIQVQLSNLNLTTSNYNNSAVAIGNSNVDSIQIDNCEITGFKYGVWVADGNKVNTISIANSHISGWAAFYLYSDNVSATFDNCIFEGTNRHSGVSNGFSTIVVQGSGSYGTGHDNVLTFNNCTLRAENQPDAREQNILSMQYAAQNNTVYFNNCVIEQNTNGAIFNNTDDSSGNRVYVDGKEIRPNTPTIEYM